jgi:opacity protein-like surface antigen
MPTIALKTLSIGFVAILFFAPMLLAQGGRSEVSGSLSADFSRRAESPQTQQNRQLGLPPPVVLTADRAWGFVVSYRFALTKKNSLEANYALARNTQSYALTDSFGNQTFFSVKASIHELTGDYVFAPRRSSWLSPFALAGGGVLIFRPTGVANSGIGVETQTKPAGLYGAGVDVKLSRRFRFRLQYRGVLYKPAPDFGQPSYKTDAWGHLAEASFGIVYRF